MQEKDVVVEIFILCIIYAYQFLSRKDLKLIAARQASTFVNLEI